MLNNVCKIVSTNSTKIVKTCLFYNRLLDLIRYYKQLFFVL